MTEHSSVPFAVRSISTPLSPSGVACLGFHGNQHTYTIQLWHTHTHTHTHTQAKDKVSVSLEDADLLRVTAADFEHALQFDLKPAFGISDEQLDTYVFNGEP